MWPNVYSADQVFGDPGGALGCSKARGCTARPKHPRRPFFLRYFPEGHRGVHRPQLVMSLHTKLGSLPPHECKTESPPRKKAPIWAIVATQTKRGLSSFSPLPPLAVSWCSSSAGHLGGLDCLFGFGLKPRLKKRKEKQNRTTKPPNHRWQADPALAEGERGSLQRCPFVAAGHRHCATAALEATE